VISSSGSSYTLRLADNSVILLSTSDLLAKANIRGLSLSKELSRKAVAVINPHRPNQLVIAAPSDTSLGAQSALTTLQTFDFATGHELSQQALVRNLTTATNVNSHGQRILSPDVVQLQISYDGLWLATVDEWAPPETDREPLDHHISDTVSASKTEISLKFWSLQKESNTWEMNTKARDPHSAIPQSVLKLASNPARAEVVSAGRDGYLRIWRPSMRQRNGMPVKNEAGQPLYTWTCQHQQRPSPPWQPGSPAEAESVALAYFEDGSGIAVSFMYRDQPRILQIIDSRTGALVGGGNQAHVCPPGNVEMTISWTRLLMLSDRLLVWDVVNSTLACHPILLKEPYAQDNGRFLATNRLDQTFAIALNPPDRSMPANVVVFDANYSRPFKAIHVCEIHGHVKALLPATKAPGYLVVDGQARMRRLRPVDLAMEGRKLTTRANEEAMKNLNDVFGFVSNNDGGGAASTMRPEGRSNRSLEDVLEECATSLKPMLPSELFAKVADLYKKRPDNDDEAGQEDESDSSSSSVNLRGSGP
jgi:NET1-associated nuclear protein 1 (U3 small nucleolar RNA-associated protein 17)